MKKLLALTLAAALALSLVACGGGGGAGDNSTPSPEDVEITIDDNSVVGTWSGEFQSEDGNNTIRRTIVLYKGGTGELTSTNSNGRDNTHFSGTWELKDNVLNFSYLGQTQGYEISVSENTMSMTNFERSNIILYKSDGETSEAGTEG